MPKWLDDALASVPEDFKTPELAAPPEISRTFGPVPADTVPLVRAHIYTTSELKRRGTAALKSAFAMLVDRASGSKLTDDDLEPLETEEAALEQLKKRARNLMNRIRDRIADVYPESKSVTFAVIDTPEGPAVAEVMRPEVIRVRD